jgi:type VI secretion system protein ImpM
MANGLYGKLPCKRDFVALNASRRFLEAWEPWLQGSVATSRQMLGDAWRDAFNSAPIWRFWLGADLCGEPLLGAFMPSIDGVGRSFPLTLFTSGDSGGPPPPELDPSDAWCAAAEAILLSALETEADYDAIVTAVTSLPPPPTVDATPVAGLEELPDGAVLARDFGENLPIVLRAARRLGHRKAFATQSFWWTIGGEGYASAALAQVGMPPPQRFADMLTGSLASPIAAPA